MIKELTKEFIKLLGTSASQTMLGGIAFAVMPKEAHVVYKAACAVGTIVMSYCVGKKIDECIEAEFEDFNNTKLKKETDKEKSTED